jgi:hypothetical protein
MRFYEYRGRPVAETAGRFIAWLEPGTDWTEVTVRPETLAKATELPIGEWRERWRPTRYWATVEGVEEACTHFAMTECLERAANRRCDILRPGTPPD